jgi:diaminohydroxyphosphoribosylaminopyrimidine deaminase/5-amino-6-(5-phosphoribosylamino)uracil reductase
MTDPNPKVSGKGISELKDAGIEITSGILENEARRLNEAYTKYIATKKPFVTLKVAQTLDGRIADINGNSKWITSEESRQRVHQLRSQSDAVLIGGNTARLDNPQLTSHGVSDKDPLRLVLSKRSHISKIPVLTDNATEDDTGHRPVEAQKNRWEEPSGSKSGACL